MKFDIAVIGSGPGGYICADAAAKAGKSVVLFEERELGGTCLNRGCIPTKALIHAAEVYEEARSSAHLGISAKQVSFDVATMHERKKEVIAQLRGSIAKMIKADKVTVVEGHATITNKQEVTCNGEVYQAEDIVIAAGSVPNLVPIPGIDAPGVYTSDDLLEDNPPQLESIVIIGGGVIGMEIANIYATLGREVRVLEAAERILPTMDKEISQRVALLGKKNGISIEAGVSIHAIEGTPGNMSISYQDKKGAEKTLVAQGVLAATGRKAKLDGLFDDACTWKPEVNRGIVADEKGATSLEHLWVIGDAKACNIQLAHVASAQGRNVIAAICGEEPPVDMGTVPSCVYIKPGVASVGMTEAEAKEAGYEVRCGKRPTGSSGKCLIEDSPSGYAKIVTDAATGTILGAQLVFPRATDLIAELALAVQLKLTVKQLARVIHPHPTFCEIIGDIAGDLSN
ncbi:MAG: dihydrolipoyl dehydrogenase [Coriobacteriia bacterium]|nr:dihydrolipoyl dehydrogenase [Coriobacteriia bacterium]